MRPKVGVTARKSELQPDGPPKSEPNRREEVSEPESGSSAEKVLKAFLAPPKIYFEVNSRQTKDYVLFFNCTVIIYVAAQVGVRQTGRKTHDQEKRMRARVCVCVCV